MPDSAWNRGDPSSCEARISVRLWPVSATAASALSFIEGESPAVCLVLDLIAASGGLPVARQEEALVAGFSDFQSAILAARRLQWAIQGFSEAGDPQAAALAVLIHSPQEAPDEGSGGGLLIPGEQAAPGEILLTEEASRPFENLPGFPLMTAPGDRLRELLWRAPEDRAHRSLDEEMISRLIEERGAQVQPQEEPEPPAASDSDEAFPATVLTGSLDQFHPVPVRGGPPWAMIGAVLAVLVVAAAGFLYWSHGRPAAAPDQTPTQTQTTPQTAPPAALETNPPAAQGPAAAATGSAQPVRPERAAAQPPAKAGKNGQKGGAKPAEQASAATPQPERPAPSKAQPDAPRGRCDLEPSQFSGQIDQAWKNLGRGRYADAQREFGAVLACDPGNGRAKEGLDRARMAAREADGQS